MRQSGEQSRRGKFIASPTSIEFRTKGDNAMPEKRTLARARRARRAGKAPSTQAGEFVREEIEHVREGKHGARSAKQAIAIGLSKARRAGVKLKRPGEGTTSETKRRAARDVAKSARRSEPSARRSRATLRALKREGRNAASRESLSKQARASARRRSTRTRSKGKRRLA
jgi:hypothetical protein